jgi:hypothetical protein
MAVPVDSSHVVQIVQNVESLTSVAVRNDGPNPVSISRDPDLTAAGADAFVVAVNAEQEVSLEVGQGLYAICAAGQTASVETI